jgi:hypothetical protein
MARSTASPARLTAQANAVVGNCARCKYEPQPDGFAWVFHRQGRRVGRTYNPGEVIRLAERIAAQ